MTILDDMVRVHTHRRLFEQRDRPADEIAGVLRGGWDVWETPDAINLSGMARMPHLAILSGLDLRGVGERPVLAMEMDRVDLHAGLWRQLNILPDTELRRRDHHSEDPADRFAPIEGRLNPDRAGFLRTMLGHTPADIAEFLVSLREQNEPLARLLLAKDFKSALVERPDMITMPWPEAVRARWSWDGGRDHLPPVIALVHYAELARHASNMTAHIRLSFDEHGREIFSRPFLETIPMLGGPVAAPEAVARLVEMAPFQTTALMPPGDLLRSIDEAVCGAWSQSAATAMASMIALGGNAALAAFRRPASPARAAFIGRGIAAHPRFWLEHRTGHGWSMQKGQPATCWGLGWRAHGITGLLGLAAEAREWSGLHRSGRDQLPAPENDRPLERAVAAILYGWIEAAHLAALPNALAPIINAKEEALKRTAGKHGGTGRLQRLSDEDRTIDALATGSRFGESLCAEARGKLAALPAPGEEGYTARCRAHLWLDDVGDDIVHYRRHQRQAIEQHKLMLRQGDALLRRHWLAMPLPPDHHGNRRMDIDPILVRRRLRRLLKMSKARDAARAVQDCAMMMLPPATDPIHVVNAAPQRWSAPTIGAEQPEVV